MDAKTFDRWTATVTRLLTEAGSRRRALAFGASGLAGLWHMGEADETAAKRKHRRHRKKKGKKNPPTSPPPDPCTNGVKDPGETDVDCGGGTCPSCRQVGQICNSRNDCYSDRCVSGTCQACVNNIADCGASCGCRNSDVGYKICTQANCVPHVGGTCALCGPGEQCALILDNGNQIGIECCLPCGA
jgi:hypothetical protein